MKLIISAIGNAVKTVDKHKEIGIMKEGLNAEIIAVARVHTRLRSTLFGHPEVARIVVHYLLGISGSYTGPTVDTYYCPVDVARGIRR